MESQDPLEFNYFKVLIKNQTKYHDVKQNKVHFIQSLIKRINQVMQFSLLQSKVLRSQKAVSHTTQYY